MTLYCENCCIGFDEQKRCPLCGTKRIREVQPDDMVFLTEKEQIWSSMLEDVLTQNGIPCFCKNVNGAVMTLKGMMNERVLFFVHYSDAARAADIVDELFSGGDAQTDEEENDEE